MLRFRKRSRQSWAVLAVTGVLIGLVQSPAWAEEPKPETRAEIPQPATAPSEVPAKKRTKVLGPGWKNSSDRAWTAIGDSTGFHILTADQKRGYRWETAASLSEPGFSTDMWIGNVCATASGKRAVVVYAPRTFTNEPKLMARGGFTAIVDLETGSVRKLGLQASLSYHNPGCGAGENAVLAQSGGEGMPATRLFQLDAVTGKLNGPIKTKGQVTSAVPTSQGIVAAAGAQLVKVATDGRKLPLARTRQVPYRLTPDPQGGIVFLDKLPHENQDAASAQTEARRLTAQDMDSARPRTTKPAALARGPVTAMGLTRGGGTVYVTGETKQAGGASPKGVRQLSDVPKDSLVSTRGEAVLTKTAWADGKDSRIQPQGAVAPRPVAVSMSMRDTTETVRFTIDPAAQPTAKTGQGREPSPALATQKGRAGVQGAKTSRLAAGSPSNPVESERRCSVPRNDPGNQAMQPKPRQVEWAVDQAITGNLNKHISRPANWKNLGMPAYQPQTLFPKPTLEGGGRIPAQIMLGIAAQESNMWQAGREAVPGVTANPLIGNFYGIDYYDGNSGNDWDIDWDEADCGYGVMQVTDHMRKAGYDGPGNGGTAWPYQTQRAVALDYTANVAAGMQILASKWNTTRKAGLQINDGNPSRIENWFFALWAYNSGFHENSGSGPWGVGWANNPANPEWDAGRTPFMEDRLGNDHYADAAKPQNWPYPEKVIGFAAHPLEALEAPGKTVAGFRAAWWNGSEGDATIKGSAKYHRAQAKPPENLFCVPGTNQCDPGKISDDASNSNGSSGPCTRDDFYCWWHIPVTTWKTDCTYTCGNELVRFNDTYPEEADGTAYPPNCSVSKSSSGNAAPPGALIVDDSTDASIRPGCPRPAAQSGTFSFDFADSNGLYPAKVDLHQLGAGFGGHFSYGHTRPDDSKGQKLKFTGTWKLNSSRSDWMRVAVHIPDHGAHTQQARYDIDTGSGSFTRHRYLNQKRLANNWVVLGSYKMSGTPRVRLTTLTDDGTGDDDVAFDAVAFQPLPKKPQQMIALLGDSYTSGEGAGGYLRESDDDIGKDRWNACRRSTNSWARKATLPGYSAPIGDLADGYADSVEFQDVSCSGARTWQLTAGNPSKWGFDGNFHEKTQIDSGVLSSDTTVVALTVGGNDAGFPSVIQACATTGCPAEADMKRDIDSAVAEVGRTLRQVQSEADKAKIILMGYPLLFNQNDTSCVSGVGGAGMAALNDMGRYMDSKKKKLVEDLRAESLPISYESPNEDFEGKRACDDPEGINKVVKAPNGDGDNRCEVGGNWCVSRESFHPNKTGTSAYAAAFRRAVSRL